MFESTSINVTTGKLKKKCTSRKRGLQICSRMRRSVPSWSQRLSRDTFLGVSYRSEDSTLASPLHSFSSLCPRLKPLKKLNPILLYRK
ncbi:hypothetical protein NC651_020617 [Populus alba x Populus x berolinensis]|nr:hypothetical protein NC651_020617 [Populus alba x Populus x berolinensis]